jgi:hypothetical protein
MTSDEAWTNIRHCLEGEPSVGAFEILVRATVYLESLVPNSALPMVLSSIEHWPDLCRPWSEEDFLWLFDFNRKNQRKHISWKNHFSLYKCLQIGERYPLIYELANNLESMAHVNRVVSSSKTLHKTVKIVNVDISHYMSDDDKAIKFLRKILGNKSLNIDWIIPLGLSPYVRLDFKTEENTVTTCAVLNISRMCPDDLKTLLNQKVFKGALDFIQRYLNNHNLDFYLMQPINKTTPYTLSNFPNYNLRQRYFEVATFYNSQSLYPHNAWTRVKDLKVKENILKYPSELAPFIEKEREEIEEYLSFISPDCKISLQPLTEEEEMVMDLYKIRVREKYPKQVSLHRDVFYNKEAYNFPKYLKAFWGTCLV